MLTDMFKGAYMQGYKDGYNDSAKQSAELIKEFVDRMSVEITDKMLFEALKKAHKESGEE